MTETHFAVSGCVICISNNVKYHEESLFIVILTYPCNAINKMMDKLEFTRKNVFESYICAYLYFPQSFGTCGRRSRGSASCS